MKRRDFLKVSLTGAAAFALSGLTFMAPRRTEAAELNITLVAEAGFKTMIDGKEIYVWQFNDPYGAGPGLLTSGLLVQEGDTVNVTNRYVGRFVDAEVEHVFILGDTRLTAHHHPVFRTARMLLQ